MTEADKKILRDMRAELSRVARKIDGVGGNCVASNSKSSLLLVAPRPTRQRNVQPAGGESATVLKVTGTSSPTTLGKPYYWALIQKRNTTAWTATSNGLTTTFFTNVGTSTAYVILFNLFESGSTTHDLATNTFLLANSSGDKATVSGIEYDVYLTYSIILGC